MPCWIALRIPEGARPAHWADIGGHFTPRVTLDCPGVLLLEVKGSRRLFGGEEALLTRLQTAFEAALPPEVPPPVLAGRGQTAHAALACLNSARPDRPWQGHWHGTPAQWLDPLPCTHLPGWADQGPWLSTLGVHTVRQLRALPRSGLSRRVGPARLTTLDQALGQVPEVWCWVQDAPVFELWREFPSGQEQVSALLEELRPMLDALIDWLSRRQCGVRALRLRWRLDHARGEPREDGFSLKLAQATCHADRLFPLLAERLAQVTLKRPVLGLWLQTEEVERLQAHAASLFDHADAPPGARWQASEVLRTAAGQREQTLRWHVLLERLTTRLGDEQVLGGQLHADHRPERAQQWASVTHAGPARRVATPARAERNPGHASALPLPAWLVTPPRPLAWQVGPQGLQPVWLGRLRPLAGPHRIAAAWWDASTGQGTLRDYHVMHSPQAGLLWVCRNPRPQARALKVDAGRAPSAWHLHGLFI